MGGNLNLKGKPLKRQFKILIADRNPHVRKFLQREMTADGYQVRLAESGRQLLQWAFNKEPIDLLIVDPDLPDTDIASLFSKLRNRIPFLPMVVHTHLSDYTDHLDAFHQIPFVEKHGSSIDHLKKVISDILQKFYSKHTKLQLGMK
jgi:DNA-binding NtrC family response regulator